MTENQNTAEFTQLPVSILPSEFTREQAAQIFLRTFAADKMTPTEFTQAVHHDFFKLRYFPIYLFSCDTVTSIEAECTKRGDNGISQYRSQRTVRTHFSDITANASTVTDDMLLRLLEPYDLERAVDLSDKYTADAETEKSEVSPEDVFGKIKPELEKQAQLAAEKTLNNFTDKKTVSCTHSFKNICVKEILLPVWVLDCNCGSKPYSIFLNGQTGRIAGVPPRSRKKAAAIISTAAVIGAAAAQLLWMAVNTIW